MGIPTLIKTETASDSASLAFVDGASDVTLDSTYDEYMFVCTDINPATDSAHFSFQVNATDDAGGGYDTSLITSAAFQAYHKEDGSASSLAYRAADDLAQSANFQRLKGEVANDADGSCAGILHLFNPASTTYVKHFYARSVVAANEPAIYDAFVAGYVNTTTAIDEVSFKMSSGNIDAVIKMYGVG